VVTAVNEETYVAEAALQVRNRFPIEFGRIQKHVDTGVLAVMYQNPRVIIGYVLLSYQHETTLTKKKAEAQCRENM
jgi:hypothetical protein